MKDKKLLYGIIITFIFLLSIGLTYAYFSVTTTVIGDRNEIKAEVGILSILYTDGPEIIAENIQPGWTTTKTIKVENTGSLKAFYSIAWASLTNEITNDELVLSATCTSDTGTCDNVLSKPVTDEKLVAREGIDPGEEQTYIITFEFKEISSTQNYNQGKKFNGILNVIDEKEAFTVAGTLLDVSGNPISGATVEIHSEVRTGTTDANGNFEIADVEVGTHEIIFKNSSNEIIATDTFKLISSNVEEVNGKEIAANTDKGEVDTLIKLNSSSSIDELKIKPTLKSKILSDNIIYPDNISSTYVSSVSGIDFTAKSKLTNGQGLYTNNKLEDGKNTYFRGGSLCAYTNYLLEVPETGEKCTSAGGIWSNKNCDLNKDRTKCVSLGFTYYDLKNNVSFAGHKWKIIRIDENDNIRMILDDDVVGTSAFNGLSNDNAYVGYMYGTTPSTTYEIAHTNTKNSNIKTAVDSWYNSNLSSYSNYIADAGYCNDRVISTGLGYAENETYFNAFKRNYPNVSASPRLSLSEICPNAARDLFTTPSGLVGNKALTYPVGLIMIDEARYAGMVENGYSDSTYNNVANYLKYSTSYWTISPLRYRSWAFVYAVNSYGRLDADFVYSGLSIRVSISLKPSVKVMRGIGTYDDPYFIQ